MVFLGPFKARFGKTAPKSKIALAKRGQMVYNIYKPIIFFYYTIFLYQFQ
jgi:hypothetical protein